MTKKTSITKLLHCAFFALFCSGFAFFAGCLIHTEDEKNSNTDLDIDWSQKDYQEQSSECPSATVPNGVTIKNRMTDYDSPADVYYEYLTISIPTGTYEVYKNGAKVTEIGAKTLPTAFSIDGDTGELNFEVEGTTYSSYLVQASQEIPDAQGVTQTVSKVFCAALKLASSFNEGVQTESRLFSTWSGGGVSFKINKESLIQMTTNDSVAVFRYQNDAGLITLSDNIAAPATPDERLPPATSADHRMLFTQVGNAVCLFWRVSEAESGVLVGKALHSKKILETKNASFLLGALWGE